jgi:hypothetical protein
MPRRRSALWTPAGAASDADAPARRAGTEPMGPAGCRGGAARSNGRGENAVGGPGSRRGRLPCSRLHGRPSTGPLPAPSTATQFEAGWGAAIRKNTTTTRGGRRDYRQAGRGGGADAPPPEEARDDGDESEEGQRGHGVFLHPPSGGAAASRWRGRCRRRRAPATPRPKRRRQRREAARARRGAPSSAPGSRRGEGERRVGARVRGALHRARHGGRGHRAPVPVAQPHLHHGRARPAAPVAVASRRSPVAGGSTLPGARAAPAAPPRGPGRTAPRA